MAMIAMLSAVQRKPTIILSVARSGLPSFVNPRQESVTIGRSVSTKTGLNAWIESGARATPKRLRSSRSRARKVHVLACWSKIDQKKQMTKKRPKIRPMTARFWTRSSGVDALRSITSVA